MCSATSPNYKLVDNPNYPGIVKDFQKTFALLEEMQPDVFLAAHGVFFGLKQKMAARASNPAKNPFIDPEGYRTRLKRTREDFEKKLAGQSSSGAP